MPFGPGTQRTYVVQEGETGAVYNYRNVIIPDLNLRFMRTGASQAGGRVLGKRLAPSGSLTTATTRTGRSINPTKTGVWEAPDWATLTSGATRLNPVAIDVAWRHNGVFAPWFALDDSITSFAGTLEQPIDAGIQISVLADVDTGDYAGVFNYSSMLEGDHIYLKVLTTGPIIGGAIPYSLEIDMSLEISGPPRRAAAGSLRIWQWDCIFVPDALTPFLPFDITVVNTLPAEAIT